MDSWPIYLRNLARRARITWRRWCADTKKPRAMAGRGVGMTDRIERALAYLAATMGRKVETDIAAILADEDSPSPPEVLEVVWSQAKTRGVDLLRQNIPVRIDVVGEQFRPRREDVLRSQSNDAV